MATKHSRHGFYWHYRAIVGSEHSQRQLSDLQQLWLLSLPLMHFIYPFMSMSSKASSYRVQVLSLMLRPIIKKGRRTAEGKGDLQPNVSGGGGEGVISREAVMASLQQNRKHNEKRAFYSHQGLFPNPVHTCPILCPSYPLDQCSVFC